MSKFPLYLLSGIASIVFNALLPGQLLGQPISRLSSFRIAKKHPIIQDKPAPGFFDGALLGNGGMGVNVTTRPDAIVLYFGHNNVWDIRLAENHKDEIGTFEQIFDKVKKIPSGYNNLSDDEWFNKYSKMAGENYRKPYPRPFPCGSVLIGFDRREVKVLGHTLDISNGLCTVRLLKGKNKVMMLKVFIDMESDELLLKLTDANGSPENNIFDRIKVMPDPSTPGDIPAFIPQEHLVKGILSFRQVLPFDEPDKRKGANKKDKAFRLTVKVNGELAKTSRINWNGVKEDMMPLEAAISSNVPFAAMIFLQEGMDTSLTAELPQLQQPDMKYIDAVYAKSEKNWQNYWAKSAVALGDSFLEEIWYRNLYFFNCAAKDGATCPGLFANWSYNNIGTAWHGDYHLNYNVQQPFWMTFTSNHLEKNLPYINLVNSLMPVSVKWAKEYYNLPGAYFPHSAFPVEMTINPYPLPDWGWEVSETPWAVQGLWWHYLYGGDKKYLKEQAYPPIKAAVQFLTAYMKRPDAHGGERWNDNKYHIFPTVPPELYSLRPGFKFNYDCGVDLTLTKFIFKAFEQATTILGTTMQDQELLTDINELLTHFPDYPKAVAALGSEVLVSVPGENPNTVYNLPNPLFPVFPGEDYGLHSSAEIRQLLKNTYLNQQNEGGNDLVFANMQAARIGMLDMEDFKRQIKYCLLPNGTATDLVSQTHGRYNDQTDFEYMANMGIWFENFALPAVINECLLQSNNGVIRLFPNWLKAKNAKFENLRAAGAFLVSATQTNGLITEVKILSEQGNTLRIISPWGKKGNLKVRSRMTKISMEEIVVKTKPGDWITLRP
jgi:alpha-L-fucosidase 2